MLIQVKHHSRPVSGSAALVLACVLGALVFTGAARAAEAPPTVERVSIGTLGLRAGTPVFGFGIRAGRAGARLSQVFVGGPASKAGLQPGDVLVSVDGIPIAGKPQTELLALLAARNGITTFRVRDEHGAEREERVKKALPATFADAQGMVTVRAVDLALAEVEIGKTPPDFAFQPEGKGTRLSDLAGKPVVVIFWATWCLPCTAELPVLKQLFAKYHPRGVEFVGVSLDDDRQTLERFVKTEKIPWPQVFSEKGIDHPVAQAWGVAKLPVLVLIGRDGRTREKQMPIGSLGASLEKALQ